VDLSSTQIRHRGQDQSCHAWGRSLSCSSMSWPRFRWPSRRWRRLLRGQRPPACPHHQQAVFGALGEFLDNQLLPSWLAASKRPALSLAGQTVNTPRAGCIARLHYTGGPISSAACQASSASLTRRPREPECHPHAAGSLVSSLSCAIDSASTWWVGLGRPDAALLGALAKLDQAAFVEPAHGNATGVGRSG